MDKNGLLWGVKTVPLRIQSLERFILRKIQKYYRRKRQENFLEKIFLPLNIIIKNTPYSKAIKWVSMSNLANFFKNYSIKETETNWKEVHNWLFKLDGNTAIRIVDKMERVINKENLLE